jgi:glycosyltransferase involved in cell wall biosynthesis
MKRISFRLLEGPLLRDAAAVHYASEQERAEARELGVTTRSFVIPPGVDLVPFNHPPSPDAFFDGHPELAGHTIVLYLSRLDPKKGLEILLRAFGTLAGGDPDLRLVIAGSGDRRYEARLRDTARGLGIEHLCIWLGQVGQEQLPQLFAAARAYALPSYSENFGIAALEALAAGVPSVLSDGVAVAADAQAAGACLTVPVDASRLSSALAVALYDEGARAGLSANAREFVQDYSPGRVAAMLAAEYESLLGEGATAA